jgi:glutaredoxin
VARLELFGTARCPHTQDLRDWLEWQHRDFVEYDVDRDREARSRLRNLLPGQRNVPVLVEDNKVIQVGWQGRTCMIEAE